MASTEEGIAAVMAAKELKKGEVDSYQFLTKREAESFRVCCYNAKKSLESKEILVSIAGSTVSLSKSGNYLSATRTLADGTVIQKESSQIMREDSAKKAKIEEILSDAEDFEDPEMRAAFVKDAIAALNTK